MVRLQYYSSLKAVPRKYWEQFVNYSTVGLEYAHLKAVEESGINDIHPYYIIGYENDKPVGIAYCFSIDIDLAAMADNYPPDVISTVRTWLPQFMNLRVVELGHIASLGRTIAVSDTHQKQFLQALPATIDEIAQIENADLCIIRDISTRSYSDYQLLEAAGFCPAMGFPIARIPIKWNSFEDYLAALKSKKRYNIRQKLEKLSAEEIKVEVIDDYAPYSERLSELWENVARKNNGYQHERLSPAYFRSMAENLKGRSHVVAIKLHDEIAAYGLNLIGDDEYFGVAEGLDYEKRDQYDLYANNIFEGLRMACTLQKKSFNIGVTTYDFKTSIGAEPESCFYLVKSFRSDASGKVYADFIQKNITQPENRHRIYKEEKTEGEAHTEKVQTICNNTRTNDPFTRHYKYLRADMVRSQDLYPYYPEFESEQGPVVRHKGQEVIMLGTNSYLGLGTHPKVKQAAIGAIEEYGTGCSGSPLLNGTLDIHEQLAKEIAGFIGKEDAILFSTGYQTNVGVISALVGRNDVIIMDERNHASLVDGARLSNAGIVRYKHKSLESLETVLKKYSDRPKLVVTDSLFSMEGSVIDLPGMVKLTKKYHARLMLDESHAIGVLGNNGRGVAEMFNLTDQVDIIMGTFSKSLASVGGFVGGDSKVVDYLKHSARSHIFSASLPPSAIAAVKASIEVIRSEPDLRTQLLKNADYMAKGLLELGYDIDYNHNPIIPVFCGHELIALAAYHQLLASGVFVNPVTCPAVPNGKEVLRISLMTGHNQDMLDKALLAFRKLRTTNWPKIKRQSSEYE